jgi:aminotransferase in exopolysaccharide biosynthesis
MNAKIIKFIRDIYNTNDVIPLHAPTFSGNEKEYVINTIESTYVSSVGSYVDDFENRLQNFTGSMKVIATVNGTASLHTALYLSGVKQGDLVITQALNFVAACNAIYHMGAQPIFIDVSITSLGLCPKSVNTYLEENAFVSAEGFCTHRNTGQLIKAMVPMHTFGHPVDLDKLVEICERWNIILIEDSAESLGSLYKGRHTGTIGQFGVLSFNGNKIITTGGGGALLCKTEEVGNHAKHVTTTSKASNGYEFYHDEPGFNYRMPNLNAALGCGQIEVLHTFVEKKRMLANQYSDFFKGTECKFVLEPEYAKSNYWLNSIICPDKETRDNMLEETNLAGITTRPVWRLMSNLPMYRNEISGDLSQSEWLEDRILNLPSSVFTEAHG